MLFFSKQKGFINNYTYLRQDMAECLHYRREGREAGLTAPLVKVGMGADMVLTQL